MASLADFGMGSYFYQLLQLKALGYIAWIPVPFQQFVSYFLIQQYYSRYLNFAQEKHWEEGVKMKLRDNKFLLVSSALSLAWL